MIQKTVVIVRVDFSRESVPEVLYVKGSVGSFSQYALKIKKEASLFDTGFWLRLIHFPCSSPTK